VLIEAFNQLARRNKERLIATGDLRDRTADAVLRLLGGKRGEITLGETADAIAERAVENQLFAPEEKEMIQGVLTLAERPAVSIMTPRTDIDWLDLDDDPDRLKAKILDLGHSRFLLARGDLDDLVGVALAKDLLRDLLLDARIDLERSSRQPLVVHESVTVLRLMEQLRRSPLHMAVIVDEYGSLEGIATPTDILEAITGEFPEEGEEELGAERAEDGSWLVDGAMDVRRISNILDVDLVDETDRYSTLAGYMLWRLGHFPHVGDVVAGGELVFEVVSMDQRSIEKVRIRHAATAGALIS
jgi:CBS domain containing-hemolysin-like protein